MRAIGVISGLIACLVIALPATPAQAAQTRAYKWVDADGVTHFSQTPPPDQKASVLRLKADHVSAERQATPESATGNASAVAPAAATSVPPTALEKADAKHSAAACDAARSDLALLDSDALLVSNGNVDTATVLSGEQRAAARKAAQAKIREFCDVP